ncbi:MAG: YdcF family protein [Acidimicrobiales bacterium]|jgi:vancomycin permeability regulator SanA|nr:YdcF family protein [Acidimicrobiales bacterium]MDP6297902.1 YdcF family protein [Acidimicrobiales bacterium]HJM28528.1 YdcF family protein [Acidimicrobiales bacterium]HJM97546.1 YdcF family protein [Acidimicrobiales bacterium]
MAYSESELPDPQQNPIAESTQRSRYTKVFFTSCFALALLGIAYVAVTFTQVWWQSTRDEVRNVDAIVVLGAAQWDGVPSPVLEARLQHALSLYVDGIAPYIVTTGSKQKGDRFTEAYTGLTYLLERSVPESAILVVIDGSNTFQSLSATSNALERVGVGNEVLLVSDPYHALRAKEVAREVGLEPWFSPTQLDSSFSQLFRETIGTSVGRVIGFRRASTLSE